MRAFPVTVTGIGVIAPNGVGKQVYWQRCLDGAAGIRPITAFDARGYRCRFAAQIEDDRPAEILGTGGLRTLDRTTLLSLIAAKLALSDAGLDPAVEGCTIGVVLGSTLGSLRSISEFDLAGLRDGPRYVNPAYFPNAVINSPASQISIRFQLQALNATIASGLTASLDAIGYAIDMLRLGRARRMLAGGVEEFCRQTFEGFYRMGALATSPDDHPPAFAPMHGGRRGTLLGEGAAMLLLEPPAEARRRGAASCADVLGYATAFSQRGPFRRDPAGAAAVSAIRGALAAAELSPDAIDGISVSANGAGSSDETEAAAIAAVFGPRASEIPVMAIKSLIGETFSAAGAMQVAAAIGAMHANYVPPTRPFGCSDWLLTPLLPGIAHTGRPATIRHCLVIGTSVTGVSSALVLRRPDPEAAHG